MKKHILILFAVCILLVSCGDLIQRPPGSTIVISEVSAVPQNTSATIIWTTDIPATHLVRYGTTSGTYTDSTTESTSTSTLHSVTIPSLLGDTTYFFIVQNNSAGAATATSAERSFATASSIVISILSSGTPTLTTATITWNTNVGATHLVEYGTAPSTYTYSTIESSGLTTSHSVTLSGLTSSTTYYYRVKNFASGYSNVASTEQSFVTATETPPTAAQKQRGIWIIGGLSGAAITSAIGQVDLYDPVTGNWYANVTTLPTPVSFAAVASCGGKIYVMGGFDGTSSGAVLATTQEYTVSTNSWTTRALVGGGGGSPRANIFAVTTNNRIYVLGGTTGNYNAAYAGSTTSYEYYPTTDTWTSKTAITVAARSEILELAFNDVVYHLGGRSAAGTFQSTHDGLAVTTNALTSATEITFPSIPRTGHCGVLYVPINNPAMMVVVGGYSSFTGTPGCYAFSLTISGSVAINNFQYLYYPFSTTVPALSWQTAINAYPNPSGFSAAALYGSTMYVFGGAAAWNSGPNVLVYSFNLDNLYSGGGGTWTLCTNMPIARFGHRAVTINP